MTVPEGPVPEAETVCVTVDGTGVTGLVWQTYAYDAPGAKEFPGTGTGPKQSVVEDASELVTLMSVSASAPVLVTTTRHHTSEPYTVVDEVQSEPLIGWVGSQEGPLGKVHTCTTAEMESVAAEAGVVAQAAMSANRGNKRPAARKSRNRRAAPRVILIPHLVGSAKPKIGLVPVPRNPCLFGTNPGVWTGMHHSWWSVKPPRRGFAVHGRR